MGWIRYVSTGRKAPPMHVMVSMNNGLSWQNKELLPGQSFAIPTHATNLTINNVPYQIAKNFEIREGQVIIK